LHLSPPRRIRPTPTWCSAHPLLGTPLERALKAAKDIKANEAEPHLVEALERAATEMADTHRRLMQGTYYAVLDAEEQLTLKQ